MTMLRLCQEIHLLNVLFIHKAYQDGTVFFVEEQCVGRKELAAVTMWKKKNPNLTGANRTETTLIPDFTEVSDDKYGENLPKANELGEKIAQAEVDVNPTDAQKEAVLNLLEEL